MITFITSTIDNPWSDTEIRNYERYGSQRDTVQYNSFYNWRIKLTEKNVFLCSIKQEYNRYQNFYLLAVKRNLFYFIMYVPQMDIYRNEQIKTHELTKQMIPKLGLSQQCVSSYDRSCDINDSLSISDGSTFLIKVNANVEAFLFPREKRIVNSEILKKYALMGNTYNRAMKEFSAFENAWNKYIDKLKQREEEQKEKMKKVFTRMVIRKGIIHGVPALFGLPGLGALLDLDSLFGIDDLASMADMASTFSAVDILDIANSVNV